MSRVSDLEAALEPFARLAKYMEGVVPPEGDPDPGTVGQPAWVDSEPLDVSVRADKADLPTVGDVRRAAQVLGQ